MTTCQTCHGEGTYESTAHDTHGRVYPGPDVQCDDCPICEWCCSPAPAHEYSPEGELLCLECFAEPDEAPPTCGDCGGYCPAGELLCSRCWAEDAPKD